MKKYFSFLGTLDVIKIDSLKDTEIDSEDAPKVMHYIHQVGSRAQGGNFEISIVRLCENDRYFKKGCLHICDVQGKDCEWYVAREQSFFQLDMQEAEDVKEYLQGCGVEQLC